MASFAADFPVGAVAAWCAQTLCFFRHKKQTILLCRRPGSFYARPMKIFHDFDAWGDAVSGATLRLACDAVETGVWTLGLIDLGGVVLQVASEGGGNLCYGANTHATPILFVPLTRVAEQVVNGESLDTDSLFAIPSGADFRICIRRRSHAWCSIALPIALPIERLHPSLASSASRKIVCPPGAVARLTQIVSTIASTLLLQLGTQAATHPATQLATPLGTQSGGTAAHRAAGRALVEAAVRCLSAPPESRATPIGRTRLDRAGIVRRAMAAIESAPTIPKTTALAEIVGVTDRTLLRTFHETYGVPPKQYLMLRELHRIRRSLRTGATADATVADVLTLHGIWEFGRFAARYRRQFGELPSDTLRHARA